jgi:autotransporter-associated beta strand protein
MKNPGTLLSHNKFRKLRRVGFSWAAAFIVLMILTFGVFVVLAGTNGSWNADVSDVWSNSARWLSNNIADGAGATGNFTFNITATRTITIDGAVASRTLGILNIGDTNASNSYTIAASGGGTLTLDNTPNSANAQLNNTSTSGANNTISAPILLNSSLDISNASANNLTLSGPIGSSATSGTQTISLLSGNATITGVISNGATGGTLALAKSGAGTFTLNTATNTYSGGTSINSGTISFNNKDSLGSGTVTLGTAGGGSATLTTSTGVTLIPNNIVVASGSGGTLTLGSTSTSSGSYGVSAGTSTLTLNGDLSLTAAGTTNPLTMNSLISGAGALTKVGVGIATMSNANTYSGGTTISVGTLQFAVNGVVSGGVISTGPVGKGTLTFSDGVTLRSNGATARTIQNNLSLSGNITLGDATNTGALTFNSTDGTNTLTTAATATLTGNTMLTTPSAVTIADVISGNFTLTKAGASTLTLSGANTYTGLTTVSAGTLKLSKTGGGTIPSGDSVTINGGTLEISSDQTISGLTMSSGALLVDPGVTLTITGTYNVTGGTINNQGTIKLNDNSVNFPGTGATVNNGTANTMTNLEIASGTVTLTSSLIVSGTLKVSGGTFDQGASFDLTAGTINVSSGATLKNFGTGDLFVGAGGVTNAGTINYDGSGAGCGGLDAIAINSSDNATQRSWSGTGSFSMTDVTVSHQGGSAVIIVRSGTDTGTNGANWVFVSSCAGGGGATYTWNQSLSTDYQIAANWTPARATPSTTDTLIFDGSTTPVPTVTNVPTQTIASLQIINGAFVNMSANASATLTISGGNTADFSVGSGNSLTLSGTNALKILVTSNSTGLITGFMTLTGNAAHQLLASGGNSIVTISGSDALFTTDTSYNSATNPFGTGAGGNGSNNSIIFASGSTYIHNNGASPFGSPGPVVIFQTGSEADYLTATGFDASGRTYANLVIGNNTTQVNASQSGTGSFQFDNLTVKSTSSANSTLTYTGSGSSAVTIQGNITSTGTGDGTTNSDVTLTAGSGGVVINNSVTFSNSAGSRTITFGSNATVNSNKTLTLQRNLLITNSGVLTINGTLSAGANGYVIGSLLKTVSSSATFEVGTANGYSPVSLANINGSNTFTVLAVNAYMSGLSQTSRAIKRYWTLTNGGITSADITFQYVPGAIAGGGDESANVTPSQLNAFRNSGGSLTEFTPSSRNSNIITISGVSSFSDWTLANSGSQVTLAILRSFNAFNTGNGNLLQWQTSYEVDNIGFNLYRMEGNNLVRVTPSMVAGSALRAGQNTALTAGMSYSWYDAKGAPDSQYYLEDVDLNGTRTMNGPFVPVPAASGKVANVHQATLLNELHTTQASTPTAITAGPAAQFTHTAPTTPDNQTGEPGTTGKKGQTKTLNVTSTSTGARPTQNQQLSEQRIIASGQAVKIAVKQAGWYRVTQPELVAAGLPASVDPRLLQLYADGIEQPILVQSSNSQQFGADGAIEFYGTGLDTQMTDTHIYWLIVGTQPGKRINSQSNQVNQSTQAKGNTNTSTGSQIMMELPTRSYAYTVERRDRTIFFSALLNGAADNYFGAVIGNWLTDQSLKLTDIDQLVSGPATLEIALQGVTNQKHQVKVLYNGIEMGTLSYKNQEHAVNQILIPRSSLIEGDNIVTLQTLNGSSDISDVDYIRLTYYHTYQAENDGLTFSSPYPTPLMLNGFTTSQVRVFDITDPNAVTQVDAFVHQKGTNYVVNVPEGNANRILMAVADSRVLHPSSVTANTPSNLMSTDNHADFIILTHPNFRDAVTPLADLRNSQGLGTMVVNVDDVYDEFSYGSPSRDAIRDFFAYATQHWAKAPRYVLLVGDASTDPRNYLNTSHPDFVPTMLIDTSLLTTASDDAFVDFNNDGIADISIGRLPAQTLAQAQTMIAKITGYVPGQSGTGVLLISDQNRGYDFEGATNAIHTLLPANIPVMTIDRGDLPPDQVRDEIIAAINQGPMIVNYAGHGSTQIWSGSGIFSSTDATALTNGNRVPFFVSMTCLNGIFEDAFTDSLAESLMKADGGGAVAVWASSGLTEPDPQAQMDQQLMRLLFSNGQSPMLGDAVRGAKQATTDLDVRRTWIFFGDPTMRIR